MVVRFRTLIPYLIGLVCLATLLPACGEDEVDLGKASRGGL